MNLTDQFIDTLMTLREAKMPEEVLFMARKCLLEETGLILAGAEFQKKKLNAYLDNFSGDDATALGLGRKASLQNAAFVNGISGHSYDFDDGHRFSTVHLASAIIPAVLAVAEKKNLGMEDMLRGIVIGYETAIRLGNCVQPAHRARGFHSTSSVGTVGASMAVAALLNFDRQTTKDAMAASFSCAGGINEMMENISTMKPFNAGRADHDGITSAFTALAGFNGPYDPLAGKFGFLRSACETYNESVLLLQNREDLSGEYHITGGYHKPYASCRHAHAPVYASLQAAKQAGLAFSDIDRVKVEMYGQGIKGHDHTVISSATAGKMSTPFCVALGLKTGRIGIDSFGDEYLKNPEILALTEKVTVEEDPEMTALVPKQRSARSTVFTKDGRSFTYQADYAIGEPELPLTTEDIADKFTDVCRAVGKEDVGALREQILYGTPSARELIAMIEA